ncbi:hypothetical protein [Immundisolibacter cernigliae]|uniref:hypothetical protein n=1 Tax=Immundisolibacter cernigliae TaxID=1810504 RepID=UPI0011AB7C11|nr:hypothetical protein [Immundisolibacter cernigliae]
MTGNMRIFETAELVSATGWKLVDQPQSVALPSDTRGTSNHGVLMVQGRIVEQVQGGAQFVVTVDPAAIDRKLAIRKLNDRLEGYTPRNDTFADTKAQR